MAVIIGLHDREAARIARREMPSLKEAQEILTGVDPARVLEIAAKSFDAPESVTPEELDIVIADRRVRLDEL